jgi:hypothetical protein
VVLALGNKPKSVRFLYQISSFGLGLVMATTTISILGLLALTIYPPEHQHASIGDDGAADIFVLRFDRFQWQLVTLAASGGFLHLLAALLHGDVHHLLLTILQYMLLLPTLTYVLPAYAFCNLHDLSWGTKGAEDAEHLLLKARCDEDDDNDMDDEDDDNDMNDEDDEEEGEEEVASHKGEVRRVGDATPSCPSSELSPQPGSPGGALRGSHSDNSLAHVDEKGVHFLPHRQHAGDSMVAAGSGSNTYGNAMISGTGWLVASFSGTGVRSKKLASKPVNGDGSGNGSGDVAGGKSGKHKKPRSRMYSSAAAQKQAALRREEVQETEEETQDRFEWFRTWVVLVWMGANCMLLFGIKSADPSGATFLKVTLFVVTVINCFRFAGSIMFLVMGIFEAAQAQWKLLS